LKSRKEQDELCKDINDYKYTLDEEAEEIDLYNSKSCNGKLCNGRIRNFNKFYLSKNRYSRYCKKCERYNGKLKRDKIGDYIDNIKLEISECQSCNKKVTKDTCCCFDFDHLDQKTKKNAISFYRSQGANQEIVKTEIEKCQLLCCHCHKKKTVKQLNYKTIDENYIEKYQDAGAKDKQIFMCQICNKNEIDRKAKCCANCYLLDQKRRKAVRPPFDDLENEVAKNGFLQTGKKYGVSDNAIRKWLRYYIKHENKQVTKIKITM